ncbi:MAG: hypothetical protein R2813_10050 [Flavobacteriales bacterium]
MIELNEMTQEELRILHGHWVSDQNEIKREKKAKDDRFNARLNTQGETDSAQEALELRIANAQTVYDDMVGAGVGQASLDLQQEAIDALRADLDALLYSTSYLTHQDQRLHLMAQAEFQFAIDERAARITEIEALLT